MVIRERGPQNREELSKVVAYVGFFARVAFLIEEGAVDLKTVNRMFAFRFFLAAHNRHVQEKILYAPLYEDHWRSFFVLYRNWVAVRQCQGQTTPWNDHSLEKFNPERYSQLVAIPDTNRQ